MPWRSPFGSLAIPVHGFDGVFSQILASLTARHQDCIALSRSFRLPDLRNHFKASAKSLAAPFRHCNRETKLHCAVASAAVFEFSFFNGEVSAHSPRLSATVNSTSLRGAKLEPVADFGKLPCSHLTFDAAQEFAGFLPALIPCEADPFPCLDRFLATPSPLM